MINNYILTIWCSEYTSDNISQIETQNWRICQHCQYCVIYENLEYFNIYNIVLQCRNQLCSKLFIKFCIVILLTFVSLIQSKRIVIRLIEHYICFSLAGILFSKICWTKFQNWLPNRDWLFFNSDHSCHHLWQKKNTYEKRIIEDFILVAGYNLDRRLRELSI